MDYRKIRLGKIGNSKVIDFAFSELVRYLRKMDNDLVIDALNFDGVDEKMDNIVWVGLDEKLKDYVPHVSDAFLDDAMVISVKDGKGYITGSNERSVLFSVYRFLRELGCAWVRPSLGGERVPEKKLDNIEVSVCEVPSMRHRCICIEGSNTFDNIVDAIDFFPKVCINSYFIQFNVPRWFFSWRDYNNSPYTDGELSTDALLAMVKNVEEEIKRRGMIYHKVGHGWTCEPYGVEASDWDRKPDLPLPEKLKEHIAELKGERNWAHGGIALNTNLCYSNPDARKMMIDAVVEYSKKNKHVHYVHVWLADGNANQCECEKCREKIPADWYVLILNELDEALTKEGLDTKIGMTCSYLDLLWGPEVETIKNPSRFIALFCPARRNDYGMPYRNNREYKFEPENYERNMGAVWTALARSVDSFREWQKALKCDSAYFAYNLVGAHYSDPTYEKCALDLFNDIKDSEIIGGINGIMPPNLNRCYFPTGLPMYELAAISWNMDADFDKIADEYYDAAYGVDGVKVRDYLKAVSDLLLTYSANTNSQPCGVDRIYEKYCKDYKKLRKTIKKFIPTIKKNIEKADMYVHDWKILLIHSDYLMLLSDALEKAENKSEDAGKALKKFIDWIGEQEPQLRHVLDGPNCRKTWNSRVEFRFVERVVAFDHDGGML